MLRPRTWPAAILAMVLLSGCGASSSGGQPSATTTSAAAPPVLGTTDGEAVGRTVDGIQCQAREQVLFHIHAHIAVVVNGQPATIPAGIGIAPPRSSDSSTGVPFVTGGSCFYWLHSHTSDGIIHIESPMQRTFTLGNYFDLWNQPLSPTRVGAVSGQVTAYLDGRPFSGDPRAVPLGPHAVIQLDVGSRIAPVPYTFTGGL